MQSERRHRLEKVSRNGDADRIARPAISDATREIIYRRTRRNTPDEAIPLAAEAQQTPWTKDR